MHHQFDVAYSTDTNNWTFLTSVDITTATGATNGGAWTFHPIRNLDGTPYFDGSGLPHFMFGASDDNQVTAKLWENPPDQPVDDDMVDASPDYWNQSSFGDV